MRVSFTILLVVIFSNLKGQESSLYLNNGQLRVDTTLQIDNSRFNEINRIERYFLPDFYNKLTYPEIGREYNIRGLMIVKVTVDKGQNSIEKIIEKGFDPHMDTLVFKAIEELETRLISVMLNDSKFEFYIPILFELKDDEFEDDLKKNGAVTIKSTLYTMQRRIVR